MPSLTPAAPGDAILPILFLAPKTFPRSTPDPIDLSAYQLLAPLRIESQDISQVLMGRAASWRKRGGDNPGAAAIERLADDLARRLPPMPPPEPEPHSDPT